VSRDRTTFTPRQVEDEGLDDWRMLFSALHVRYRTGDFATGLRMVARIGAAAEEADHHPDLDLRYGRLGIKLSSHDARGVTSRDLALARTISAIAAEEGATADPSLVQVVELALDTWDAAEIKPFWSAVLALEDDDDEVYDAVGSVPTLWFQDTDEHDEPRQRFHLDVRVPPELAEARVAAALAAGGTLVSDERAPTFWVLADPQGNKACVTTWRGRGDDA
jgi:4a-hydroxytetrahydrobiopterin dehydratase